MAKFALGTLGVVSCAVVLVASQESEGMGSTMGGGMMGGPEGMMGHGGDPCDQGGIVMCFLPFMSWAMSGAAQQFTTESDITLPQFNQICQLSKTAATCFQAFTDRCIPQTYADVHVGTSGIVKMLELCNEPEIFPKVQKYVACGRKINDTLERCGNSVKESMPKDVTGGEPMAALQRQNAVRDLCCVAKKFEKCYMPEVSGRCGAEAVPINQEFLNRVYASFQCANHLTNCPAALST
ncbi:hypothetical protein RvY_00930 [Ramazzottius varieornatus]|uniref:DUF19 domain-containing protein n=1 Tax=Ramazzottius varieornatus TaxID=947166 RepID=A0A1D1UEW8_RAMVA|nr:hypothetical protein RvY_00930 [Ramazzottius varieornatus]